jgi:hypothetical protein
MPWSSRGGERKLNKSSIFVYIYLTESYFSCWPERDSVWLEQESGGIRKNPEESGVNTGIPFPQEFLQKNPVTGEKNRNSCDPLQNHVPVKKTPENSGKKETLRNPVFSCF